MKYYPAYLDLRNRPCLVVGGGTVAERKAVALFDAGADVTVVSPGLAPGLVELAHAGKIAHREKTFDERDVAGMYLVIAATDDHALNESVGHLCRNAGILVNVATSPETSTFIVPSVVERGNLLIAISTCGDSPALARRIREELERTYGPEYVPYLEKMAFLRHKLRHDVPDEKVRREILQAVVDSDVIYLLRAGETHEAERRIAEVVKELTGRE